MGVDKTREGNHVLPIDHLGGVRFYLAPDRGDTPAFDQNVRLGLIPERRIHGHYVSALNEDGLFRR